MAEKRVAAKRVVAGQRAAGKKAAPTRTVSKKASTSKKVPVKKASTAVKAAVRKSAPSKRAAAHASASAAASRNSVAEASTEQGSNPFEAMREVTPGLLWAQNAWLAQIDSLSAPDRKTHELIRMVCSVASRNHLGIRHHSMLAGEVGATWEEVIGSIVLAGPAFGLAVIVEAFPWARKGWEWGAALDDGDGNGDGDE